MSPVVYGKPDWELLPYLRSICFCWRVPYSSIGLILSSSSSSSSYSSSPLFPLPPSPLLSPSLRRFRGGSLSGLKSPGRKIQGQLSSGGRRPIVPGNCRACSWIACWLFLSSHPPGDWAGYFALHASDNIRLSGGSTAIVLESCSSTLPWP